MATDSIVQDIRYAVRGLRHAPHFTGPWAVGSFSTAASIHGLVGLLLAFTGTYGVVAFIALPSAHAAQMDPSAALRSE